jgi:hypothetical protein
LDVDAEDAGNMRLDNLIGIAELEMLGPIFENDGTGIDPDLRTFDSFRIHKL